MSGVARRRRTAPRKPSNVMLNDFRHAPPSTSKRRGPSAAQMNDSRHAPRSTSKRIALFNPNARLDPSQVEFRKPRPAPPIRVEIRRASTPRRGGGGKGRLLK